MLATRLDLNLLNYNHHPNSQPFSYFQVTYVTGYHAPELPPAVNQLVVDNFLFRNFQDTFVMSVMKEEATLWSLLAGIGEGWQAILHTHRSLVFG